VVTAGSTAIAAIGAGLVAGLGRPDLVFATVVMAATTIILLVAPSSLFSVLYPLLQVVGQVPFQIGGVTVSLERVLVVLGGVGLIGGALITHRFAFARLPRTVIVGVALVLGAYVVSLTVFYSEAGAVEVFGLVQKAALAYLVVISITEKRQLRTLFAFFLAASFFASLVTVSAYWQTHSLQFIRAGSYVQQGAIGQSLYVGLARTGAGNLVPVWVSFLYLSEARGRSRRLFWGLAIIWFTVLSLFALRRETIVLLIVGLLVLSLYKPIGMGAKGKVMSMALAIIVAVFVILSPEWRDRLLQETVATFATGTDARMVLLLRYSPAIALASPLVGIGPGNYALVQMRLPDLVTPEILSFGGIAAHNSWSAMIVEAGVFAFLGLCLILIGVAKPLIRIRTSGDLELDKIQAFSLLIFMRLLGSMFFGNGLVLSETWFWLGVLLALINITERESALERRG